MNVMYATNTTGNKLQSDWVELKLSAGRRFANCTPASIGLGGIEIAKHLHQASNPGQLQSDWVELK